MAREKSLARRERGELETFEPWNTFRDMERMFREFFMSPLPLVRARPWLMPELRGEIIPEVDLKETEKDITLTASLPGLSKDDIDIDVTSDRITISGERKTEEEKPEERYHVRQQSYGSFRVSYVLPSEVKSDDVKATYKNGVLEVVMPKVETAGAHKVQIESEEK